MKIKIQLDEKESRNNNNKRVKKMKKKTKMKLIYNTGTKAYKATKERSQDNPYKYLSSKMVTNRALSHFFFSFCKLNYLRSSKNRHKLLCIGAMDSTNGQRFMTMMIMVSPCTNMYAKGFAWGSSH